MGLLDFAVVQWSGYRAFTPKTGVRLPAAKRPRGSVVERRTFNPMVAGSIPAEDVLGFEHVILLRRVYAPCTRHSP